MGVMAIVLMLGACAKQPGLPPSTQYGSQTTSPETYNYLIGPGDQLQIFVWRNPEVSQTVTVRPDGKISTPLVEDLQASGKTSAQLAKDLEKALETYIRQPIVTVIVVAGIGPYSEQIRVIGQVGGLRGGQTTIEGGQPRIVGSSRRASHCLSTKNDPTGRDGDGRWFERIRRWQQNQVGSHGGWRAKEYEVRLDDLLNGDISANVDMLPGDIPIVPESWFLGGANGFKDAPMNDIIELVLGYLRGIWRHRWYAMACAWLVCILAGLWSASHPINMKYQRGSS